MSINDKKEIINTTSINDVNVEKFEQGYVEDEISDNKIIKLPEIKKAPKHFLQVMKEAIDKQINQANNDDTNVSLNTDNEFEVEKEAIQDPSLYWNAVKSELDSNNNVIEDTERVAEMKDEKEFKLEQKKRVHKGLSMEDYYPDLDMNVRIQTLQQNLSNENGANKTFDLASASEETLRKQIGSQCGL